MGWTSAVVGAQAALFAALLYYFGLIRNSEMAHYLGFFQNHLNASLQWHMQSSVPALYMPLLVAAGAAVMWRLADRALRHALARRPRVRRWCSRTLLSAAPAFPVGVWAFTRLAPAWWELGLPFSLTTATLLACYGSMLRSRAARPSRSDPVWTRWTTSAGVPAVGLVVILVFWTVGVYAGIQGRGGLRRSSFTTSARSGV
ncbi:hypothetical protein [Streptomyces sp. NPDC048845]|uniref:hypothetical protein n=1 Tax=Streptomyces sp. NPDC048845 TaxID=3155390 RepID=UPI0034197771